MSNKKSINCYLCPRCGYKNNLKYEMKRHFKRKTLCPDVNGVSLTDDIKEHVLTNHTWNIKNNPTPTNIIHNYNILVNFIERIDTEKKLEYYLEYTNSKLLDFDDGFEEIFESKLRRLEDNDYKIPHQMDQNDIYGLVNDVTKIDDDTLNRFNVYLNKKINRILFYSSDKWNPNFVDNGIKKIVKYLQSYYLNDYEKYLIRNIYGTKFSAPMRVSFSEHLKIYYRFLIALELEPLVKSELDIDIIGHYIQEHNPTFVVDHYMKMFKELQDAITKSEINNIKKELENILKDNAIHNIGKLNKYILSIIKIDEVFRHKILQLE